MRAKEFPVSETKIIQLAVTHKNKAALAYFEKKIMNQFHVKDCCLVTNADIINYAINLAMGYDQRRRNKEIV